jgi:hypothetical protein
VTKRKARVLLAVGVGIGFTASAFDAGVIGPPSTGNTMPRMYADDEKKKPQKKDSQKADGGVSKAEKKRQDAERKAQLRKAIEDSLVSGNLMAQVERPQRDGGTNADGGTSEE